jgi:alkylation response protein AidB-like acyl-CoA dehydrogenase
MNLTLTDDQSVLTQGVRDFLAGTYSAAVLRKQDSRQQRDPTLWQGFVDMGLTGLCVPAVHGGLGLGLLDAALIAAECGRACVAEPLVDTAFVAVPWLLARGETAQLADIAAGKLIVPLAHSINPWVENAEGAPLHSVDPLRKLSASTVYEADPHLLNLAALMCAAQLVGLAEAMLAQATDYAKVRQQFGQPIGAFQAIKHQLASALVAIEFAKPVVWHAAQALQDSAPHAAVAVAHAKIVAGDAAWAMSETAIQVHGAMGYTYDVDLHYWMKRSWALAAAWGDRAFHLKTMEAAVIGGGMPIGADHTFG